MAELTPFRRELIARFPDCLTTSGGEVWVRYEDALAALHLAHERGWRLLGMDGYLVDDGHIYVSMSRIADYSDADAEAAYTEAEILLRGPWVGVPDDLHAEAKGAT